MRLVLVVVATAVACLLPAQPVAGVGNICHVGVGAICEAVACEDNSYDMTDSQFLSTACKGDQERCCAGSAYLAHVGRGNMGSRRTFGMLTLGEEVYHQDLGWTVKKFDAYRVTNTDDHFVFKKRKSLGAGTMLNSKKPWKLKPDATQLQKWGVSSSTYKVAAEISSHETGNYWGIINTWDNQYVSWGANQQAGKNGLLACLLAEMKTNANTKSLFANLFLANGIDAERTETAGSNTHCNIRVKDCVNWRHDPGCRLGGEWIDGDNSGKKNEPWKKWKQRPDLLGILYLAGNDKSVIGMQLKFFRDHQVKNARSKVNSCVSSEHNVMMVSYMENGSPSLLRVCKRDLDCKGGENAYVKSIVKCYTSMKHFKNKAQLKKLTKHNAARATKGHGALPVFAADDIEWKTGWQSALTSKFEDELVPAWSRAGAAEKKLIEKVQKAVMSWLKKWRVELHKEKTLSRTANSFKE